MEDEIIRPRRRGEPRPEPQPQAAPEPAPAGAVEEREPEPEPQPAQPAPALPEPQAAQPVQAAAVVTRSYTCSHCGARLPLAELIQAAPMMILCADAEACAQRAAASGLYLLDERQLEMGLSIWER